MPAAVDGYGGGRRGVRGIMTFSTQRTQTFRGNTQSEKTVPARGRPHLALQKQPCYTVRTSTAASSGFPMEGWR